MRILVAVDGSRYSTKATKHVAKHSELFQEPPDVHLLNVQLPVGPHRTRGLLDSNDVNDFYRRSAKAALSPSEKLLHKHGLAYHSTYAVGQVADEVRKYAKKNKIDLIVMGSHGQTALQNILLGSAVTKVLATTPEPVLVVR